LDAFRTAKLAPRLQEQIARFSPQDRAELTQAGLLPPTDSDVEADDDEALESEQDGIRVEIHVPDIEPPDYWHLPVEDKNGRIQEFGKALRARATVVIVLRHFGW
jgi:hypothetical protein